MSITLTLCVLLQQEATLQEALTQTQEQERLLLEQNQQVGQANFSCLLAAVLTFVMAQQRDSLC